MTALLVTSISALLLQSTLFTEFAWPKLKAMYAGFLQALDTFAEARMRNAVRATGLINSSHKGRSPSAARKKEGRR